MKYFQWLFLALVVFLFLGCANKISVDTLSSNELSIDKSKKKIFLEVVNTTDENIYISYDIKKGLKNLGYIMADEIKDAHKHLKITIVYAGKIDKNSTTKDILRDINVNVGIGSSSGNVGIYTSIGATLGKILGDKLDSTLFQVVVDVHIEGIEKESKKPQDTQLILTAPLDGHEKGKVIYFIEEEISQQILKNF